MNEQPTTNPFPVETGRQRIDQLIKTSRSGPLTPTPEISAYVRGPEALAHGDDQYAAARNTEAKPADVLYDADAIQDVPFRIEHKGAIHQVVFRLGPQTDDLLLHYDEMIDTRLHTVTGSDTQSEEAIGKKSGIMPITDAQKAAIWLFDKTAMSVSGIGAPGQPLPDDWKQKAVMTPALKENVITKAYLLVEALEPEDAPADSFIGWDDPGNTSTVTMRALFSGHPVIVTHTFCPPSAEDRKLYDQVKRRAVIIQGSKVGKADTKIPASWRTLGRLYDRLIAETSGYAGRVPLHHKVAALDVYMAVEIEAVAKN